jgi:hypothetical protein
MNRIAPALLAATLLFACAEDDPAPPDLGTFAVEGDCPAFATADPYDAIESGQAWSEVTGVASTVQAAAWRIANGGAPLTEWDGTIDIGPDAGLIDKSMLPLVTAPAVVPPEGGCIGLRFQVNNPDGSTSLGEMIVVDNPDT